MPSIKKKALALAAASNADKPTLLAMQTELETNPEYSLEADPTGALGLSDKEKDFIKWYAQHRNIAVAAQIAGMSVDEGLAAYKKMASQSELRRISTAIQLRQLNTKALDVDQIGSMLSAYVLDKVPDADRLSSKEKMDAMKMLLDINAAKAEIVNDPAKAEIIDVESQVKTLSVDSIKSLLKQSKENDAVTEEKEKMIDQIDSESKLSNDDLKYLRSLSVKELAELLNEQHRLLNGQKEDEKK